MRRRENREHKKQDWSIVDFMMVTNNFFHPMREWILEAELQKSELYPPPDCFRIYVHLK